MPRDWSRLFVSQIETPQACTKGVTRRSSGVDTQRSSFSWQSSSRNLTPTLLCASDGSSFQPMKRKLLMVLFRKGLRILVARAQQLLAGDLELESNLFASSDEWRPSLLRCGVNEFGGVVVFSYVPPSCVAMVVAIIARQRNTKTLCWSSSSREPR